MTLRETELIGKKLVKYGFYRSRTNHYNYTFIDSSININVEFKKYFSTVWVANFTHDFDYHTRVIFTEHAVGFTPQWLVEENKKLQAMFKFLRS
jgi:hypothetical protein